MMSPKILNKGLTQVLQIKFCLFEGTYMQFETDLLQFRTHICESSK